MKRVLLLLIFSALVVAVAVHRFIQIAPYPMGGGQHLESPNGKYEAHATSLYDEDFWGQSRSYYEFEIRHKENSRSIRTARIDHLAGQDPFPMREGKRIIAWSADSTEATYAFQGMELRLTTTLQQGDREGPHQRQGVGGLKSVED